MDDKGLNIASAQPTGGNRKLHKRVDEFENFLPASESDEKRLKPNALGYDWGALLVTAFCLKDWSSVTFPATMPTTVIAGLIVGVGATVGSGCTSGHGICGLARFSIRSVLATVIFMATGAATVFVIRHMI